jgi:hypothetical protein
MAMQTLQHIPLWVFALLLGLIAVPMTSLGPLRSPCLEGHRAAAASTLGTPGPAAAGTPPGAPSDLMAALPGGQRYVAPPPLTLADLMRPRNRSRADAATYQTEVPDAAMRDQLAKARLPPCVVGPVCGP